jgi:hypothetical protein
VGRAQGPLLTAVVAEMIEASLANKVGRVVIERVVVLVVDVAPSRDWPVERLPYLLMKAPDASLTVPPIGYVIDLLSTRLRAWIPAEDNAVELNSGWRLHVLSVSPYRSASNRVKPPSSVHAG